MSVISEREANRMLSGAAVAPRPASYSVLAPILALIGRISAIRRRRRATARLGALSDHVLRDIGMPRGLMMAVHAGMDPESMRRRLDW